MRPSSLKMGRRDHIAHFSAVTVTMSLLFQAIALVGIGFARSHLMTVSHGVPVETFVSVGHVPEIWYIRVQRGPKAVTAMHLNMSNLGQPVIVQKLRL